MIKIKKSLSLLVILLFILSNAAFAATTSSNSGIDEKAQSNQETTSKNDFEHEPLPRIPEDAMMGRLQKTDLSEDDMRAMAKANMGDKFSEEEFQKGIKEMKERMQRKDVFSYENEGYSQGYDFGPSYEGYQKEERLFGMVFQKIGDDIDPRDIKQYCSDPSKIADIVIAKLKEKIGDVQNVCKDAEKQETNCNEMSKKSCSQIGTGIIRQDATDIEKKVAFAYSSCPVNPDAIKEACKTKMMYYMEQKMKNSAESCAQRFDFGGERLTRECEKFKQYQVCDKDKFMAQCMGGIKKEDFDESGKIKKICPAYPVPQCREGSSVQKKIDANGCVYYYCEGYASASVGYANATRVNSNCPYKNLLCSAGQKPVQTGQTAEGCPIYECMPMATCPDFCKSYLCCDSSKGACPLGFPQECSTCSKDICASTTTPVCAQDVQQCHDGSYVKRIPPNCNFESCPDVKCPEAIAPSCQSGQNIQKKTDDKGCVYYYCETVAATTTTQSNNTITGSAIYSNTELKTYDDYVAHCENSWLQQQKICSNAPNACDKGTFIEKCKEQEQKNNADFTSRIGQQCETQSTAEIKNAQQRCNRIDENRKRCLEQSEKRCYQMHGIAQQCRETLTEEKLRNFIIEEAKKRCKFSDILENENDIKKSEKAEVILAVLNTATQSDLDELKLFVDNLREDLKLQDTTVYKGIIDPNRFGDIKLLPFVVNAKLSSIESSERAKEVKAKIVAGMKTDEAAKKLVSLRDSDVPKEYLYIIEDKANDVLNVSDNLKEIEKKEEEKGVGYKIRLFLGFAKKAEQEEIKQLEEGKDKLSSSIDVLTKLVDEIPSDVAKSILKEQVENLKKQQEDIDTLIKAKEKKAKGLLGLFG